LVNDVVPSLLYLKSLGFEFIVASNQDNLGTELFPLKSFEGPQNLLIRFLKSQGIFFEDILICPHGPKDSCECRKPKIGLFKPNHFKDVFFEKSFVVGDRESDLALAKNLGFNGLKIDQEEGWQPIINEIDKILSSVQVKRKTKETNIDLKIIKNNKGNFIGVTGLPFIDHMFDQISKHSGLSIEIKAKGDLFIDNHHLIEDLAISFGEGVFKLFKNSPGLNRFGYLLPMDESLCQMAIDISGRPFCSLSMEWSDSSVGEIKTSIIEHFFRSFAHSGKMNMNLKVSGRDNHHICEASFKALGKCLEQAFSKTGKNAVRSTKGLL